MLRRGHSAVLISIPHAGVALSPGLAERLSAPAAALPDTDWFVDRLYAEAGHSGAGCLVAPMSRYVLDLNRSPRDEPLYTPVESALVTGLVPLRTFSGEPIYHPGAEPTADEIARRVETCWRPYHQCLATELRRLVALHGFAVLLDGHSIRSEVPLMFDGRLPDFNLGTNAGRSADHALVDAARQVLADSRYSLVVDGRFRGGYITRHYGQPAAGVHAIQLEMAQSAYMEERAPAWSDSLAAPVQALLHRLLDALVRWRPPDDHSAA